MHRLPPAFRAFLISALLVFIICPGLDLRADEPFNRERYLLLDSRLVDQAENVILSVGTVKKHPGNPLFGQDYPWEPNYANFYGNIHYDSKEQVYKLWYNLFLIDDAFWRTHPDQRKPETHAPGDPSDFSNLTDYGKLHHPGWLDKPAGFTQGLSGWHNVQRKSGVCYATSRDGIHWEKPFMDIVPFHGLESNILLWDAHGAGVFYDEHERDPARKYKIFTQFLFRKKQMPGSPEPGYAPHISVAFSADGLHWGDMIPCPEIASAGDTHNNAFWAPELNKYVGITRHWKDGQVVRGGLRLVNRTESPDYIHWTKSVEVLRGTPEAQTYAMPTFRYADVYLGLVMILRTWEDRMHCELAWSPDTIHWERIDEGVPLIPNGPDIGKLDWGCVFACDNPVILEDEIRLYYQGTNGLHAGWKDSYLCAAGLRPDGFAGYGAIPGETGVVTTNPILCSGAFLKINADVNDGAILVGIEGDAARSTEKCLEITESLTDGIVKWDGVHDVADLHGSAVRVRFEIKGDARVYSIRFTN
jgi:hypothetical protein